MKIIGLEEAIREYQKAWAGQWFRGCLLYDTESGEVWTDYVYEDADKSWNNDYASSVVDLGEMMCEAKMHGTWASDTVTVENVHEYILWKFSG